MSTLVFTIAAFVLCLAAANRSLRQGKEYSGFVTMLVPDRRMVIEFASLEPVTNRRRHSTGWKVIYDFTPGADGRTRVEIAIEYGRLTAIATGGLAGPQAENDIVHRLSAMRMLEAGVHGMPAGGSASRE